MSKPRVTRRDREVAHEAMMYPENRDATVAAYREEVTGDLVAALRSIANETCNHGPSFCPREIARAALEGTSPTFARTAITGGEAVIAKAEGE